MHTVAIVGASGLVGQTFIKIINDNESQCNYKLFGNNSVGNTVNVNGVDCVIEDVQLLSYFTPHYAVFCTEGDVSSRYAESLAKRGCVVIDNSSYFRLHSNVPLVVPSVNGRLVNNSNLIANPNCTTIQIALAVNALTPLVPTSVCVATYQATSGAGKDGLADLTEKHGYGELKAMEYPVFDNVIPKIGNIQSDGYTSEEHKIIAELPKILGYKLDVNAMCVRVPVTIGHGAFVNVTLSKDFTLQQVTDLLENSPEITLADVPLPESVRNTSKTIVGRITKHNNSVNMFVVADNLFRGASYNAWQILKLAEKKYE